MSIKMLEDFGLWVKEYVTGYDKTYFNIWKEPKADDTKTVMLIQDAGGARPYGDVTFPIVRLFLFGKTQDSGFHSKIYTDQTILQRAALELKTIPCGATGVKIIARPTSPGLTKEDRAWTQIDFQLIF